MKATKTLEKEHDERKGDSYYYEKEEVGKMI
jgi:hypothetical protein